MTAGQPPGGQIVPPPADEPAPVPATAPPGGLVAGVPVYPSWLKLPDDGPATLLPPWPDRIVTAPNKQAALTWVERLSLPLRHKRALLTSWGAYTGVALSAGDFAYLSDFQAPRGPA